MVRNEVRGEVRAGVRARTRARGCKGEGGAEAEAGSQLEAAPFALRCLMVSPTSHLKYSRSRSAASPASCVSALTLYESFT